MRSKIQAQARARTAAELTRACFTQIFGLALTVVFVAMLIVNAISDWFFCRATAARGRPGLGQCGTSVGGFAALESEARRAVITKRLVARYRQFATDYRRLAAMLTNPADKQASELFASGWERIAEKREVMLRSKERAELYATSSLFG
jgi:hypothetical protein